MIHHMARCSASSSARRRRASRALGVCRSPSTSSASSCGCSLPSTGTSLACREPARSASPGQPVGRARPPDRSLRRVRLPARHVPAMRLPDPPLRPAARRLLRRGARLGRDRAEIGRRFRRVLRRGREGFPVVHTHKAGHRARDSGHGALLPLLHPTARTSLRQAHLPSFSDDCAHPHAEQFAFGAKGGGLAAGGGELFDAPPEFEVRRPGWGTGAGLGRRQTILVGEGSQGEIPAATRLGLLGGGGGRVPRRRYRRRPA